MSLGIRGANPIWSEVDLQGNLFDDTFYLWVLQNTLPYMPATVYHDPDLNTPWTNPIQFLGNGTLPIDIYFESDVVYRLEFRQSNGLQPPSQNDPLIYEVNNYVAGEGGSTPIDTVASTSSNQITNPQFAQVNFNKPWIMTGLNNPPTIAVAPGWFLDLTGAGNVTITQLALNNSNKNPSNAPYALELNLSGFTTAVLRQRFNQNGMLWSSTLNDTYVSNAITTRLNGANSIISANLFDSQGQNLGIVLQDKTVTQQWTEWTGYLLMPATTNPNTPPNAYIEYRLNLPGTIDISVTSIQLVVSDLPVEPDFDQDSIARQIDHTFHYWQPLINQKAIPSYLVGWDFYLNPAQFFGKNVTSKSLGNNTSYYAWDQTILFQSINNSITVGGQALTLTSTADTQIGIIQYISPNKIYPLLNELLLNGLSCNIRAFGTEPQTLNVSLWWTPNALPSLGSNQSLVLALDANGHPSSVVNGWIEVKNIFGQSTFNMSGAANDYSVSGFLDATPLSTAQNFAIVIGTNVVSSGNSLNLISASLTPGFIPTIPAPQTPDEVLRECQYFYETSYANVADFTSSPTNNASFLNQQVYVSSPTGSATLYASPGYISYKTPKRVNPQLVFYSIAGTLNNISAELWYNLTSTFTTVGPTDKLLSSFFSVNSKLNSFYLNPNSINSLLAATPISSTFASGGIAFQWVSDARLGVV